MTKEAVKVKVLEWDTSEIKDYITDQLKDARQNIPISDELDQRFKKLKEYIDYINKCRKDAEAENQ